MAVTIALPTLHPAQVQAFSVRARFRAIRCGRRWGKTEMGSTIAEDAAIKGQFFGIFAPDYKILAETYTLIAEVLAPITITSSKVEGVIRLTGGGRIDFWTLNNPRAGRSRKYHGVLLDEVAFAGPDMMDIWTKAIRPSLLDFGGYAIAMSTPNGADEENFFWRICNEPEHGFVEYHAPTHTNPFLPASEVAKLQADNHPDVYRQEYLAEFVDWRGTAFFSLESFCLDGKPATLPERVDMVYATIDTALKDGLEHDGTGVVYWAKNTYDETRLYILDWDVLQIQGAFLEDWLPSVQARLEELATSCKARFGNAGPWIEDKGSGTVLIQQAIRHGIAAHAIDGELVAMGKEGRALNISGYVHRGQVKLTQYAFDKITNYRGQSKNHFLSQVCGFRMGTKTPHTLDLLDCFTEGVAIGLGNSEGF